MWSVLVGCVGFSCSAVRSPISPSLSAPIHSGAISTEQQPQSIASETVLGPIPGNSLSVGVQDIPPVIEQRPVSAEPLGVWKVMQGKLPHPEVELVSAESKIHTCLKRSHGSGELLVKITIATSGFALNVDVKPSGDIEKEIVHCIKTSMREHEFGAPIGGGVAAITGTFQVH